MLNKKIFDAGGFLLVISGAMFLFYWLISLLGGFEGSIVPALTEIINPKFGITVRNLLVIFVGFIFSIGVIFAGLVLFEVPRIAAMEESTALAGLEKKVNRLQELIWRIIQKIKEM